MVLAEAAIAGILLGLASGGRMGALGELEIKRVGLAYAAILLQVVAFPSSLFPWSMPDGIARGLWLLSFALLIGFSVVNRAVRGVALVCAGLASNLAAVLANGGLMPASPHALRAEGVTYRLHNNSISAAHPHLAWLTDRWAVPHWIPWGNVFSVGDVLVAVGIAATVALAMHKRSAGSPSESDETSPCTSARRASTHGWGVLRHRPRRFRRGAAAA